MRCHAAVAPGVVAAHDAEVSVVPDAEAGIAALVFYVAGISRK